MPDIQTQSIITLTQQLVQISSESGREEKIAAFLSKEMLALGFDNVWSDEHGSVVGEIHCARSGPTILLDAHIDTVGVAPGVAWKYDPYGGELVDGRIYGRGASDMKGALGAMLAAAAALDRDRLAGRVIVVGSVLEEVLEGVALKAVMDATGPDYVVIGEASELRLVRGGRGRAEIHLETIGRPSHSSAPQNGVNAVHAMITAIQAIDTLELPTHPVIGEAIMALTDIISEPYPGHSVIPSRCHATYDRRLMPGETRESVLESLVGLPTIPEARLNVAIAEGEYTSFTGTVLRSEKWFPAWLLETTDPFVQKAAAGLQKAGLVVDYDTYRFCTNAAYSIGTASVPTVGFGPSCEDLVHISDEYIQVEQLLTAARGYKGIVESVLG